MAFNKNKSDFVDLTILDEDSLKTLKDEIQKELNVRKEAKKQYLIENLKNAWTALEEEGIIIENEGDEYYLNFNDLTFVYKGYDL
jgi:hypothetical protein